MPTPYTDLSRPPLVAASLRRALVVPGGLWTRLDLRGQTGSTNADAVAAARAGVPEGLVVVAEQQTAGRGRLGRTWVSPPRAGLAVSVLLRPGRAGTARGWPVAAPTAYGWLPLLAGVALAEAVARVSRVDARLKWPNDLLVGDRKCGGVLAEAVPVAASCPAPDSGAASDGGAAPDRGAASDGGPAPSGGGAPENGPAVVIGIGLNVTLRADELPATATGLPATSLRLAGAEAADRDPLLRALLRGLAGWYERWRDAAGDAEACGLRAAYLGHCGTLGRHVRVLLPAGERLTGAATTVDDDGRLMVRTPDGDRVVAVGDVVHLR